MSCCRRLDDSMSCLMRQLRMRSQRSINMKRFFYVAMDPQGVICAFCTVLLSLTVISCSKRKKEPSGGKPSKQVEKQEHNVVDLTGRYKYKEKFPSRDTCTVDRDCHLTQLRPGDCCPEQCEYFSVNVAWLKVLRKIHYPICPPFFRKHGFSEVCGDPKCKPLSGTPKARCKDGRCVVEYIPFLRRR